MHEPRPTGYYFVRIRKSWQIGYYPGWGLWFYVGLNRPLHEKEIERIYDVLLTLDVFEALHNHTKQQAIGIINEKAEKLIKDRPEAKDTIESIIEAINALQLDKKPEY